MQMSPMLDQNVFKIRNSTQVLINGPSSVIMTMVMMVKTAMRMTVMLRSCLMLDNKGDDVEHDNGDEFFSVKFTVIMMAKMVT